MQEWNDFKQRLTRLIKPKFCIRAFPNENAENLFLCARMTENIVLARIRMMGENILTKQKMKLGTLIRLMMRKMIFSR